MVSLKIVIFYICFNFILLITKEEAQKALYDLAYSLFLKTDNIQYDNSRLTYQAGSSYKTRNKFPYGEILPYSDYVFIPEGINKENKKFCVCSQFITNLYYNTFQNKYNKKNYEIKVDKNSYARTTDKMILLSDPDKSDLGIYFLADNNIITEEKYRNLKKIILDKIEPGDVIIYRFGGNEGNPPQKGHAVIYLGNNTMFECSGNNYNTAKKKDCVDKGIKIFSLKGDKNSFVEKRIFNGMNKKIGIFRPLNDILKMNDYEFTEQAKFRIKFDGNIKINKICSVNKYDIIELGEEITYLINIENISNKKDYINLHLEETVPENTELVEIDYLKDIKFTYNNESNKIIWKFNLNKSQNISIRYSVKIKNDLMLLGKEIINNDTFFEGFHLNKVTTRINIKLSSQTEMKIKDIINKEGSHFENTNSLINEIYSKFSFPNDLDYIISIFFRKSSITLYSKEQRILNHLSDTYNNINHAYFADEIKDVGEKDIFILKKEFDNKIFGKMLVKGLFGGIYTLTENEPTNDDGRCLFFDESTFNIGDILIIYDDDYLLDNFIFGEKNYYLYLGDNSFATVYNKMLKIIKGNEGKKLIESLLGQNCFFVLRPSLI